MLKLLFNRTSPVVRLLELVGLTNSFLFLKGRWPEVDATVFLYLLLLTCWAFVRTCSMIHWYPGEPRERGSSGGAARLPLTLASVGLGPRERIGVEVHFAKALVPTSYIFAVTSTVALSGVPILTPAMIAFADLLMLIVAPVNGIVIWFYLHDRESLPINYFSLNKHLSDNEARNAA